MDVTLVLVVLYVVSTVVLPGVVLPGCHQKFIINIDSIIKFIIGAASSTVLVLTVVLLVASPEKEKN